MKTTNRNNVISMEEARRRDREIPQAWLDVIGILKGKRKISALAYQRKIRAEWDRRTSSEIPAIWKKVFGMMKGKRRVDPVKVQRAMRRETEERLRRQIKLGRKSHASRH